MACKTKSISTKSRLMTRACAFALLTAGLTVPAFAQATETTVAFNMQEQTLDAALKEFGVAADRQVMFSKNLVEGKRVDAVSGDLTPMTALDQLLDGTGLVYEVTSSNVILVKAKTKSSAEPQQRASSNGEKKPTQMAQVERSDRPIATAETVLVEERGPTGEGLPATVTGRVTDIGNQANLKGAQVEIVETGQRTATDDLGRFRFPQVRPGTYTLYVSYLGYIGGTARIVVESDTDLERHFQIEGGSVGGELIVYGTRSARSQALNQERTADNVSTVISSDLLGNFPGATLSESLRRAPGVVFERDSQTGEGTNISIRGLAADLNTVKFNGVELPEGTGFGRAPSLSNVLTESIGKVTISKTLLPNQDSSGTGGLVEIETKTPLDRPRRYASFTFEGGRKAKGFGEDFLAAGTVSGKFGASEEFGLSASLQLREREFKRSTYRSEDLLFGQYLPLQVDGTTSIRSTEGIDPRMPFPFEPDVDEVYPGSVFFGRGEGETDNLALSLSGAWEVGGHSILAADYQRLTKRDTAFSAGMRLNPLVSYSLNDVVSLGGEERRALEWRSNRSLTVSPSQFYRPGAETISDVFSFKADTKIGNWNFNVLTGYTKGTMSTETYQLNISNPRLNLTVADLLPAATHSVEGRALSPFPILLPGDDNFPEILLSEAGFNLINDTANYAFSSVRHSLNTGRNERFNGEFSARYDFGASRLKYLEAGLSFERSEFSTAQQIADNYFDIGNLSVADFGLFSSQASFSDVGVTTRINQYSRDDLVPFLLGVPSIGVDCNPFVAGDPCPAGATLRRSSTALNPLLSDQFTGEDEFAAYVQGAYDLGKLEIVGGVRMTKVEVEAANLVAPTVYDEFFILDQAFLDANSVLVTESAAQTDFLPRILANYRQSENLIFRGGYFLSVARPQVELLSVTPNIFLAQAPFFGPNRNQPNLTVVKGNPDLKPAKTHNFDFSAEYYDDAAGVLKFGAFYKRIDDLLESNIAKGLGVIDQVAPILPDDPRFQDVIDNPEGYDIDLIVPNNNDTKAEIWGVEISLERQFTSLPGVWKGLGVYANYTYTDSSKEQPVAWFSSPVIDGNGDFIGTETQDLIIPDVRFDGQANHSGTFGLNYNQYGIDANLAYTVQARRQLGYGDFNLHRFEEGYGTLDFRAEYHFDRGPGQFRVYVEGTDLTRGPEDAAIQNTVGADDGFTGKYFTSGVYLGGRQIRVGVSGTF